MYISSLYDDILQHTVARTLFREVGGIHHSYCSYVPPHPFNFVQHNIGYKYIAP